MSGFFDRPAVNAAYERYFDPPEDHEEDGCLDICHVAHRENGVIQAGCEPCEAEKCPDCNGSGYTVGHDAGCLSGIGKPCSYKCPVEVECKTCQGRGRTTP